MRIIVTQAKFDELFSIDDWFAFSEMTNKQLYEKMILFAANDEGESLTPEQARAEFRKIARKEWPSYVTEFYRAVSDAFVNPTSAGG
jgi:hypothetical protein